MSKWCVIALACAACGKPSARAGAPSGGKLTDVKVTIEPTITTTDLHVSMLITDTEGKPQTPQVDINMEVTAADSTRLCFAYMSVYDRYYDQATHRLDIKASCDGDETDALRAHAGQEVTIKVGSSNLDGATDVIIKAKIPDDRSAFLPALDAELAKLASAVKDSAPATLPVCSPKNLTVDPPHPLPSIDSWYLSQAAIPDGNLDAEWFWLTSPNFNDDFTEYRRRTSHDPDGVLTRLDRLPLILVYLATERKLPSASGDRLVPGVFIGHGVVIDRAAAKALCAIPLEVHGSSEIGYTRTTNSAGTYNDASKQMVDDLKAHFHTEVAERMKAAGLEALTPERP